MNRLADEYGDRVKFVSLDARGDGQAAFEAGNFRGHPAYVLMQPDGREVWRGYSIIAYGELERVILESLPQKGITMRRWAFVFLAAVILAACGKTGDNSAGGNLLPPTQPATLPPTLDINAIPVLGETAPAPPVPLLPTDPRFPIRPADGEAFEAGKRLYEQHCAACHGLNGEGQQPDPYTVGAAPPHDNTGHTWHHPDQVNFATVWEGRHMAGSMPAFYDDLTPDEILLILGYIKTWWGEDELAHQMQLSEQAAQR